MGVFEGFNKAVFVLSYVLLAGGGLLVSVFMMPLRDPRTEARVQGYLYTFWETIRIPAVATLFVIVGTALSIILISSLSIMWSLVFFGSIASAALCWYKADRLIIKGASDPRSMVEVDKKSFHRYLIYSDLCILLSAVSIAFLML